MRVNFDVYDVLVSLRIYLIEKFGHACDIMYDGYKTSEERPLFLLQTPEVERLQTTKMRESREEIYYMQVDLRASDGIEKIKLISQVTQAFLDDSVPLYIFDLNDTEPIYDMDVILDRAIPFNAKEVEKESDYNLVSFDLSLRVNKYKRGS